MPLVDDKGEGLFVSLSTYTTEVQHVVTYYHFAFEEYMARLIEKFEGDPSSTPEAKEFVDALTTQSTLDAMMMGQNTDIYSLVQNLSAIAVSQAAPAGRASIKFFPAIPQKFLTFDGVASKAYMDDNYWATVFKNGHDPEAPGKPDYFAVIKTMYAPLGADIRSAIKTNLSSLKK